MLIIHLNTMRHQRQLTPYELLKFFADGAQWRRLFSKVSTIETAPQWRHLYETYLDSQAWCEVRQQRLAMDQHRCVCCGSSGEAGRYLEVHHQDYQKVGGEDVAEDVRTLCRHCFHRDKGRLDFLARLRGPRPWDEICRLGYDSIMETVRTRRDVAAASAPAAMVA